jgi:hypothetical protein
VLAGTSVITLEHLAAEAAPAMLGQESIIQQVAAVADKRYRQPQLGPATNPALQTQNADTAFGKKISLFKPPCLSSIHRAKNDFVQTNRLDNHSQAIAAVAEGAGTALLSAFVESATQLWVLRAAISAFRRARFSGRKLAVNCDISPSAPLYV